MISKLIGTLMLSAAAASTQAQVGYLGPAGSWTHQACIELFGEEKAVALTREELFKAFSDRRIESACVPVTTSIVGATPYMDDVLALPEVTIVAEYPKMLGYSLLAKPGASRASIRTVIAHPIALEEVKPWLDAQMPHVERRGAASGGAASREVANAAGSDLASMGPPIAAKIYGLSQIATGIEEGPHNVTRWWVIGRQPPAPSGKDKTTLMLSVNDAGLDRSLRQLADARLRVLTFYERPSKRTLDSHQYVVEVEGHAAMEPLRGFLAGHPQFRWLGSYPRKY
jgi:chorismate mutase / prephenate dehydratase